MKAIYKSSWQAYLLLLPTLAASVLFLYYPAADTFRMSVYRTVAAGANKVYVGLDNFHYLFTSGRYQYSFFVSLLFALVVVAGTLLISVYLGFLIYRIATGESFYLVTSLVSYSFSFAIIATVMLLLLHPTVGLFTYVLESATGIRFDWLSNDRQAFVVVSVTTVLKMIGYNVIFIVGAFSGIPETINETAKLDGIGSLTLLTRVYVPLISPTLAFLLIMNTVYAFFLPFPIIDIMTRGGPGNSTSILIYTLYQTAFGSSQFGLAAAQSIILFVLVGGLMLIQLYVSDRYAHYGGA